MNDLKQKILELVKKKGPIIPVKIAKELGSNLMFTSAIMSELVSNKAVKLTKGKIGSSPLYYVSGQEHKLVMLKDHLGGRRKEAFSILQEKKILRDSQSEPWLRVALREIQDFAQPITVQIKGNTEIFWKWYMVSVEVAKKKITEIVSSNNPVPKKEEPKKEEPKEAPKVEPPKEPEVKKEVPKVEPPKPEEQKPLVKPKIESSGDFHSAVLDFLRNKEIEIIDTKIVRKNREFNFIVKMPSPVGSLMFFIKAKNKLKINDADLSLAYSEGQQSKLPVIFMSSGELTKKATTFINDNIRGLVFKKV